MRDTKFEKYTQYVRFGIGSFQGGRLYSLLSFRRHDYFCNRVVRFHSLGVLPAD